MQLNAMYVKFLISYVETYVSSHIVRTLKKRYVHIHLCTYLKVGKERLFHDDVLFHPLGVRPSVRNVLISKKMGTYLLRMNKNG